ncbi:uncharacterized protein METZ01_LOCUS140092 [marine metagenome]|uniref:Uncharacterized protein n=1 Tax=marine metagenome TaxID=408172 RepID=A0A381ZD68_9ZZZZ|tara:strand:+ start:16740 stop:17168 length:429 start_codon:yes stop_codon:yes gene_type:complete
MTLPKIFNDLLAQLENKYIGTMVSLFLVLYGGLARPALPNFVKQLLANDIFRMLYVFLLAYIAEKNVQVALVCAVVFMVLNGLWADAEVKEAFESLDDEDFEEEDEEPDMGDVDDIEAFDDDDEELYDDDDEELYDDDDEEL